LGAGDFSFLKKANFLANSAFSYTFELSRLVEKSFGSAFPKIPNFNFKFLEVIDPQIAGSSYPSRKTDQLSASVLKRAILGPTKFLSLRGTFWLKSGNLPHHPGHYLAFIVFTV